MSRHPLGAIVFAVTLITGIGISQRVIQPGLSLGGRQITLEYDATSTLSARVLFQASPQWLEQNKVAALVVKADGKTVTNEEDLRQIIAAYLAAASLYERPFGPTKQLLDTELSRSIGNITKNPAYLDKLALSWFKKATGGAVVEYAEAFRGMVTAPLDDPALSALAERTAKEVKQGETFLKALERALDAAQLSNNAAYRNVAKSLEPVLKDWTKTTSVKVSIGNKQTLDLITVTDVLKLALNLAAMEKAIPERLEWLRLASLSGSLDKDQKAAADLVLKESEARTFQVASVVGQFLLNKGADLAVGYSQKKLGQAWVSWAFKTYGTRTTGHLVAGVFANVTLAFTLGDLIYGLDDLHANFNVAAKAVRVHDKMRAWRLGIEASAKSGSKSVYDGKLAQSYRAAYLLEALAAGKAYQAYADGVEATVERGLLTKLNPIYWLKDKEWKQAVSGLRQLAKSNSTDAYSTIGLPAALEPLVYLALRTQIQPTQASAEAKSQGEFPLKIIPVYYTYKDGPEGYYIGELVVALENHSNEWISGTTLSLKGAYLETEENRTYPVMNFGSVGSDREVTYILNDSKRLIPPFFRFVKWEYVGDANVHSLTFEFTYPKAVHPIKIVLPEPKLSIDLKSVALEKRPDLVGLDMVIERSPRFPMDEVLLANTQPLDSLISRVLFEDPNGIVAKILGLEVVTSKRSSTFVLKVQLSNNNQFEDKSAKFEIPRVIAVFTGSGFALYNRYNVARMTEFKIGPGAIRDEEIELITVPSYAYRALNNGVFVLILGYKDGIDVYRYR